MLLLAGFPPTAAQVAPLECDTVGRTIQRAVDAAPNGGTVRVCSGIYAEQVLISKSLKIVAQPNTVLDGTALHGTRFGFRLAAGVSSVTIEGFEIRNFRDPFTSSDFSGGIVALGDTTNIRITRNHVHDNAFAGVLASLGTAKDWRVDNNTFTHARFVHVFLHGARDAKVDGNTFESGPEALLLSHVRKIDVHRNVFSGSGLAAVAAAPEMGRTGHTNNLVLRDNTITGKWLHGAWLLAPTSSRIEGNRIDVAGADITSGANPEELYVAANTVKDSYETKSTRDAIKAFKSGTRTVHVQSDGIRAVCGGLPCWLATLSEAVFGGSVVAAPVQADPATLTGSPPVDCAPTLSCSATDIQDLFNYTIVTALNPLASPETAADASALSQCAGQPDACLSTQFFDPSDASPSNGWTTTLVDPGTGTPVVLRFVDAGLRSPGALKGWRSQTGAVDQEWSTFVICRLYVGTLPPQACHAAPRVFDFGLDITWIDTTLSRHVSAWHLREPTDAVHATFDRVHGPDATLFKLTVRPHGADSPPPLDANVEPLVPDPSPLKTVAAGRLTLRCTIGMSLSLPGTAADDCDDPVLAKSSLDGEVFWCAEPALEHAPLAHLDIVVEAVDEWQRIASCDPVAGEAWTTWTDLLDPEDLADLSDAHVSYYEATTPADQTAALDAAEEVLVRAIARHVAIRQTTQGMPLEQHDDLLDLLPTVTWSSLPEALSETAAAFAGGSVYVLGGRDSRGAISPTMTRFDPATGTVEPVARTAAGYGVAGAAVASTGSEIYVFGGCASGSTPCHRRDVNVFDAVTGLYLPVVAIQDDEPVEVELPYTIARAASVWDPRSTADCPQGCAYIIGGERDVRSLTPTGAVTRSFYEDDILRFDRASGTVVKVAQLPAERTRASAVFDGTHVYVFGGKAASGVVDAIVRFDPLTEQVVTLEAALPEGLAETVAVWNGQAAYIFGGSTGVPQDTVYQFVPGSTIVTKKNIGLRMPLTSASGATDGIHSFIFGGNTTAGGSAMWPEDEIVRYNAATNDVVEKTVLLAEADDFDVVDAAEDNVAIERVDVGDALVSWSQAVRPELVVFTPVNITTTVEIDTLAGDHVETTFNLRVVDTPPSFLPEVAVAYGDRKLVEVSAVDVDNRDFADGYDVGSPARLHTIPLVRLANGTHTTHGLVHGGIDLPQAAEATACALSLWTARSDGTESNVAASSRLAAAPEPDATLPCTPISDVLGELAFRPAASISLELRRGTGSGYVPSVAVAEDPGNPWLERVDDPHANMARTAQAARTRANATDFLDLTPKEAAVIPQSIRIILEVPSDEPLAVTSQVLANLTEEFADSIGIFAVEIEGLPLTRDLADAVADAARNEGTIFLVPAGTLPVGLRDDTPQDKLLTIDGLAADLHVITVGAGSVTDGVAPWSRRGPTANFVPKPDVLAASPTGTTAAAVANVLPLVEAAVVRGHQSPDVVRAILGAYATPVRNEAGAPAIFWEQGFGAVDLSAFFTGLTTPDIVASAARSGETSDQVKERLRVAAGLPSKDALMASAPNAVFGLATAAEPALRAAVAQTLLHLVVDTPALPQNRLVDFGLVNHNATGRARFAPVDLDAVLNATLAATRIVLEGAGYDDVAVATHLANASEKIRVSAAAGQEVTLDATHYYLWDLLKEDFLYTAYRDLVQTEASLNTLPQGATEADTADLVSELQGWALKNASHFVRRERGIVDHNITVDPRCDDIAVAATFHLANLTLKILDRQISNLEKTLTIVDVTNRLGTLAMIRGALPRNSSDILSNHNQAYLASQSTQLQCLEDQKALLTSLRANTTELRDLKNASLGAWERAETLGAWNATPLGTDIGETLEALGVSLDSVGDNATVVLDATIEVLTRALDLLEGRMNLTKIPRIHAGAPTGLTELQTLPEATRNAPIGPYVGIATMTSHNVTVYNPVTGSVVLRKDVTIPLLSFLHNNPTLHWQEQYRDTSGYNDSTVILRLLEPRPLRSLDLDTTVVRDDVVVDLGLDPVTLYGPELPSVVAQLAELDDFFEDSKATKRTYGYFADGTKHHLETYEHDLANWEANLTCLSDATGCADEEVAARALERALASFLTTRTSHLGYQAGKTDDAGRIDFPNLFPGAYEIYVPYPYFTRAKLTGDVEIIPQHEGAFDGDIHDADAILGRLVDDTINGLPSHPSGDPRVIDLDTGLPLDVPAGERYAWKPFRFSEYGSLEVDGNEYTFHGADLSIKGPDLVGIACLALRKFNDAAGVAFAYPGCGLTPSLAGRNLTHAVAYAKCILGREHASMGDVSKARCEEAAERLAQAEEDCARGRCLNATAVRDFRTDLENITGYLENLTRSKSELIVPWVRSPTRLLHADPGAFGLDAAKVAANSADDNEGKTPGVIEAAVQEVLGEISDIANHTMRVRTPARDQSKTHTLAVGISSHITDRVGGMDWVLLDSGTAQPFLSPEEAVTLVDNTEALFLSDDDKSDLSEIIGFAADPEAVRDALEAGLQKDVSDAAAYIASGWRANGTISRNGLTTPAEGQSMPFTTTECGSRLPSIAGIQAAYFVCRAFAAETPSDTRTRNSIERVQFAQALLEEARHGTDPALALEKAAAIAGVNANMGVERSENGLILRLNHDAVDPIAPVGVAMYSVPLPMNEHVQFRIDGEFMMQGTGAILVASGNEVVSEAVLKSVDTLTSAKLTDPTVPGIDVRARVLNILQAALIQLDHPEDTLLRVDLLGAPVKVEEMARVPLQLGGVVPELVQDDAQNPWNEDPSCEDGEFSRFCEHGMIVTRSGTVHNFTRTYEFGTKYRGVNKTGPETLDLILVYFPLVPHAPAPVTQEFMVNNLTVMVDTYIGLGIGDADCHCFDTGMMRVGYRRNVEDWTMLYGVPDQVLGANRLRANWTMNGTTTAFTADEVVRGLNSFLREEPTSTSTCPDDFASGDLLNGLVTSVRGHSGGLFRASTTRCVENRVVGLQPVSEVRGRTSEYEPVVHENEPKRIIDALQYVFNVAPIEALSDPVGLVLEALPADLFTIASVSNPAVLDEVSYIPKQVVRQQLANAHATADDVSDLTPLRPVLDLRNVTPFLQKSFIPSAQGAWRVPTDDENEMPVLHNFVVLTADDVRPRMPDPADFRTQIRLQDKSEPTAASEVNSSVPRDFPAAKMPVRNATDHHGVVLAHHFDVRFEQEPPPAAAENGAVDGDPDASEGATPRSFETAANFTAEVLAGHGATGAGIALSVTGRQTDVVWDDDLTSFIEGHNFATSTAFEVELHLLGGNKTAGSDCRDIPVWLYARGHYRCVGSTKLQQPLVVHAEGTLSTCYDEGLAFVRASRALAIEAAARDGAEDLVEAETARAFERLADLNPESVTPARLSGYVASDTGRMLAQHTAAMTFLGCLASQRLDVATITPETALATLLDAIPDAVSISASTAERSDASLSVTAALQPGNAKGGEPKRLLDARLVVDPGWKATGAVPLTGNVGFSYAIDEWRVAMNASESTLTVTTSAGTTAPVSGPLSTGTKPFAVPMVDGTTYTIELRVVDTYGNVYTDSAVLTSDVTPPAVLAQPTVLAVKGDTVLTWQVQDAQSGLRTVVIGRKDASGTCVPWAGTDPTYERVKTAVSFSRTLLGSSDPEGTHVACFTVTDWAGHSATAHRTIIVDRTLPVLDGDFVGLSEDQDYADPHVKTTAITSDSSASDPLSGLATWTVIHVNETGPDQTVWSASFSGTGVGAAEKVASGATWPNATYRLRVEATDAAGNSAVFETEDPVRAWIVPELTELTPSLARQDASRYLLMRANVSLPGFPGVAADGIHLTVAYASNGTVVFNEDILDPLGFVHTMWNATQAEEDDYDVSFNVTHGLATSVRNGTVRLFDPTTRTHDLERFATHGALNVTADWERYRILTDCSSFTLTLTGTNADGTAAHDVDLYLEPGEPATAGTDPATYDVKSESTATTEVIERTGTAGNVYTALVKHKSVDTFYTLKYARSGCPGGGGGGDDDEMRLRELTGEFDEVVG